MAQQTVEIFTGNYNDYSVKIPNVVIDFGNSKLSFNTQQIEIDDLFDVYVKLQNYLNTFERFHL